MKINAAGRLAVIFIVFSLSFITCGEMDSRYPLSGTYHVKTLVNDYSLEDCAIIRSGDKIRPYFAASVVNDPDLTGLLVYLLDPQGEIAGERVRYTLESYIDEADLPTLEPETPESGIEAEETAGDGEQTGETRLHDREMPNQTVRGRWGFTNSQPPDRSTDKIISVKSFDQDLPYFPIPKNLEPGPYSLIFEALGGKGTLSRAETDIFYLGSIEFNLKDVSLCLPTLSGSQLIPPETVVLLEAGLDFDSRLDPYIVWYQGKSIINEGRMSEGAGSLLWKAPEQAGFYPMRVEVFPIRLKPGLTGVSRAITLPVSPRAVNTGYFFDNGLQYAAQSPLSAGSNYVEQLQLIEAMALTEDDSTFAAPPPPELLRWYQFNGDLLESVVTTGERSLIPANATVPAWAAVGQSYGLSVGDDDSYSLSPISFFQKERDQGGGIFLLNVKPRSEGLILDAFFPFKSSTDNGAWITVTSTKNSIVMNLSTKEKIVEMPIYFSFSESQTFIPIVVEFHIRPNRIDARFGLGEDPFLQYKAEYIDLPGALTGEGRITLGATPTGIRADNPAVSIPVIEDVLMLREIESADPAAAEVNIENDEPVLNTIWNEFAVLFSELPFVYEEHPEGNPDGTNQTMPSIAAPIEVYARQRTIIHPESPSANADADMVHGEPSLSDPAETGDDTGAGANDAAYEVRIPQ